jgi:hypothetical protein
MSTPSIETPSKEKIIAILEYLKTQKCYLRYWYWRDGIEFVEALCGMELAIPKWMDEYIRKNGAVGPTCGSCCGYLSMSVHERDDEVVYTIIPCYCHPWGDVTINLYLQNDDIKEYAKKIADDISYY